MEIQRFAECEQDEDFSDIFGKAESILEQSGSDSNSDRGTFMLNSKLSSSSWVCMVFVSPGQQLTNHSIARR